MLEKIYIRTLWRWNALRLFGKCGSNSYIIKPLRVINGDNVSIGNNVSILNYLRIESYRCDEKSNDPIILIGDETNIEQGVHITAGEQIRIGKECSILAGSVITDIIHPYEDISRPASKQGMICKPVKIGDQCFIGTHSIIMPGVTLGKHVIVGANSVVTHSFSDNCVVAGVPAKIVKEYDEESKAWIRCE